MFISQLRLYVLGAGKAALIFRARLWSYNTTLLLHTIFCPSGGKWPDNAAPSGCVGRALWPNDRHILVVCNSGQVFLGSFTLPTRMAWIRGGFVDLT